MGAHTRFRAGQDSSLGRRLKNKNMHASKNARPSGHYFPAVYFSGMTTEGNRLEWYAGAQQRDMIACAEYTFEITPE